MRGLSEHARTVAALVLAMVLALILSACSGDVRPTPTTSTLPPGEVATTAPGQGEEGHAGEGATGPTVTEPGVEGEPTTTGG